MGTRGYKIYHYKGRYFLYYHHSDSYPEDLGLEVLHEIPRNVSKDEFEEWLRKTREYVYAQRVSQEPIGRDPLNYVTVSDKRPDYSQLNGSWFYEVDLDNLVFLVDFQPLFRLDNMPPDKIFLKSLSFDHFGHRALYEHTPTQFRYNWRAPPPSPLPESLNAYNRFNNRSPTSSVHDLLGIPVALLSIDRVRTALVELFVTRCMIEKRVGIEIHILENVPDRDHIPQTMLQLALSLVNFAVGPPIPSLSCSTPYGNIRDFVWIRRDACLRITTHLDDEDNLKASVGDLVHHINTRLDKVGTVYGIACSIFHCAIVRVDKDEQGTSFAHTPALQFLPSFYAKTISTPGIEALSRLGCQASGVEFLNAISDAEDLQLFTHKESLVTGSVASKVPVEVWANIGGFITSPDDLVTLASISAQAMSAAADLSRFPLVENIRLVDVISSGPVQPIPETTEDTDPEYIGVYFYQLGCAKFSAVRGGRHFNIELGQGAGYYCGSDGRKKFFEVQSYMTDPGFIFIRDVSLLLYVMELDDDTNAS